MKIITKGLCFFILSFSATLLNAEPIPGTGYNIHLESANITGSGKSINIHRVPVIDSNGNHNYYDLSFDLVINNKGEVLFDKISSIGSASVNSVDSFRPGTYESSSGKKYLISGAGIMNDRSVWTLKSQSDGLTFNASWISGAAVGNTLIAGRSIIPSLIDGPSWGVMGSENISGWFEGGLIGVMQVGDSIVISAYHGSISDYSSAEQSFTITKVAD